MYSEYIFRLNGQSDGKRNHKRGSYNMVSAQQKELVKATVPALREHGETVTKTFYKNMFEAHPELYNIFNPANQQNGGQPRSLAASILAYAEHIDNPSVLGHMLERIQGKHVSLEIKPEHYPIVGEHLLGAIKQVMGDAATPEILGAWGVAYGQLAELMIGAEKTLYDAGANAPGGWRGFKPFRVERKVAESDFMTSFYLVPVDGSALPPFKAGQYLSVKVKPAGYEYEQIRQYSLSSVSNGRYYRITVQRELAPNDRDEAPEGLVSNYLHASVEEGDEIAVHMPGGDFTLQNGKAPVALVSGGAGITAMLCMLEQLAENAGDNREVLFLHGARGRDRHAFGREVQELAQKRAGLTAKVLYEQAGPEDRLGEHYHAVGRIQPELLQDAADRGADFYFCGPPGFMAAMENILEQLQVPVQRRHSEVFGPDPSFALNEVADLHGE